MFGRLVAAAGALAAAAVLGAGMATAAHAAPPPPVREESPAAAPKAPAKPTAVQIAGESTADITIQQAEHPELFRRLLGEVNWLSGAEPTTTKPKADKLGPKYTVTVLVKDRATQSYDLYPLASGGPRAYRPAKQPTGGKSAGWFYGRLTMSESLRLSGLPLKEKPDVVTGGIGGGIGEKVDSGELDPLAVGSSVFGEMRRLFMINIAVLLVVLAGLGGVAFLIRRRV